MAQPSSKHVGSSLSPSRVGTLASRYGTHETLFPTNAHRICICISIHFHFILFTVTSPQCKAQFQISANQSVNVASRTNTCIKCLTSPMWQTKPTPSTRLFHLPQGVPFPESPTYDCPSQPNPSYLPPPFTKKKRLGHVSWSPLWLGASEADLNKEGF